MSARPAAAVLVSALIRAVEGAGGGGMVLAKGDATAGAILIVAATRGRTAGMHERTLMPDGRYAWTRTGPADLEDPQAMAAWLDRRRRSDPDLWVVELDHAEPLAIAEAMLGGG